MLILSLLFIFYCAIEHLISRGVMYKIQNSKRKPKKISNQYVSRYSLYGLDVLELCILTYKRLTSIQNIHQKLSNYRILVL